MVEKESYTKQPFADVFKIGALKIFVIFTGKHLYWSLFLIKLQTWGLQQKCFPVNIGKFLRTTPLAAFDYGNQSKIFREITASKFQGQHAKQFNSYEGLYLATKTKTHRGFSNGTLRNFRAAIFENNFRKLLLKRKERRRRTRSDSCGFMFSLFPGQLFIYQAMHFLYKFWYLGWGLRHWWPEFDCCSDRILIYDFRSNSDMWTLFEKRWGGGRKHY